MSVKTRGRGARRGQRSRSGRNNGPAAGAIVRPSSSATYVTYPGFYSVVVRVLITILTDYTAPTGARLQPEAVGCHHRPRRSGATIRHDNIATRRGRGGWGRGVAGRRGCGRRDMALRGLMLRQVWPPLSPCRPDENRALIQQ